MNKQKGPGPSVAGQKDSSSRRMGFRTFIPCETSTRAATAWSVPPFFRVRAIFTHSFFLFLLTRGYLKKKKMACSLCRSVTETPVPAIEAGRGRRGAAVRGRRLTLLLPTLLALCWLMELCGRDGLFGVTSPLRMPTRTHPRWTSLDLRVLWHCGVCRAFFKHYKTSKIELLLWNASALHFRENRSFFFHRQVSFFFSIFSR